MDVSPRRKRNDACLMFTIQLKAALIRRTQIFWPFTKNASKRLLNIRNPLKCSVSGILNSALLPRLSKVLSISKMPVTLLNVKLVKVKESGLAKLRLYTK